MDCATISWSGTQRQAEVLPPVVDDTDRTQGICSYDPLDTRGCQTPRSCYDCLNAEVEKESGGCMINDIGRCISVADCSLDVVATIPVDDIAGDLSNNGSIDNVSEKMEPLTSRQTSQSTFEIQFSAKNTTYCEDDDVLFNKEQLAHVGFSYGTQDCVRVEVYEVPSWE
ncbi:unnamed protein product [Peronospora farinosa]|uniref:Uncharacterized protein n=1 Tax=Peronospora farinosa TaxID=134698 RepID=A0ABN8CKX0_9STRA|nr:unnamed protein product [Peronospora farinosa]